jgi:TetR/AcrR family transcriptional repressor of nem operon
MITRAEEILDASLELMQVKGFVAMSLKDISDEVGIKKPSLLHHFDSKEEIGRLAVIRYREHCVEKLSHLKKNDANAQEWLNAYFDFYNNYASTKDKVCLCGVLAAEFIVLPKTMQKEVKKFFELHLEVLEEILKKGIKEGIFRPGLKVKNLAQSILSSLQGALLIQRSTGADSHLKNVIRMIREQVSII